MRDLSFRDWSFPLKIMAGYLTGILVLVILFSMSSRHFATIVGDYNRLMNDSWRQLDSLQTIRSGVLQAKMSLPGNPERARRSLALVDLALDKYLTLRQGGIPLDLIVLVTDINKFRIQAELVLVGRGSLAELNRTFNLLDGRTFYEIERSRSYTELAEMRFIERINQVLLLDIILAPLGFLFLYYYGYLIANSTGLRLRRYLAALRQITAGQWRARICDSSLDELGQIAAEIDKLAEQNEKGYNIKP